MKKIIIEIGANSGTETIKFLNDSNNFVYAFEPTPELLQNHLYPLQKQFNNLIVIPCAVSDFNGFATFNIAGQADWGCSSLNNFNDNLNETWSGRNDFVITKKIIVPVTRMDTFIESLNINSIEYLHCDTQGSDLKVLRSFGERIGMLKAGRIETFKQNPLYKESCNKHEDAIDFLKKSGFTKFEEQSNDSFNNEYNLFFSKD
jgi:FkbM family methyltransferase